MRGTVASPECLLEGRERSLLRAPGQTGRNEGMLVTATIGSPLCVLGMVVTLGLDTSYSLTSHVQVVSHSCWHCVLQSSAVRELSMRKDMFSLCALL